MQIPQVAIGPTEGRLAGKIVAITGVGGGQGRAAALLFARCGATVIGCDLHPAGLQATSKLAERDGMQMQMQLQVVDVVNHAAARNWLDAAVARNGKLDVLYNNAGLVQFAPVGSMTMKQWTDTMRGELDVIFSPTSAAWPHLMRRGGSIINIASVSGMCAVEHLGAVAHAAAKGGVIAMTRQLALEGAPHGIRCNSISPGPIVTPATQPVLDADARYKRLFEGWPALGRTGDVNDVAYAALFLASDESTWITGINMPVDGGMTCKAGISS